MEKGLVHEGVTLEALGDAAKAVKPRKEPFHHPAIAGKLPVSVRTVLEFSSIRSTSQRNTVANATPNQPEAKGLAIVAPIRRQARGTGARASSSSRHLHLGQDPRRRRDVGHVTFGQVKS